MMERPLASLIATCWLVGCPPLPCQDAGPLDVNRTADAADLDRMVTDRVALDQTSADVEHIDVPFSDATTTDARIVGQDAGTHECPAVIARCTGFAAREACVNTPQGRRLVREDCPTGAGCVAGVCVVGRCADECTLRQPGCELYSLASASAVDPQPDTSLEDRARLYNGWLIREMLPAGGVVGMHYSDATLTMRVKPNIVGDSAEWTGTYLFSEALRSLATHATDAEQSIARLVGTLDLWLHVSGSPGYLARYVESVDHPPPVVSTLDCSSIQHHCNVLYQGEHYNWHGWTSRDMFQGVMTGLAVAYDATSDENVREVIRRNVMTVVEELVEEKSIPADVYVDGVKVPITLHSRYIILNQSEMDDGRVVARIGTSDVEGSSEIRGFMEFVPDFASLLRQVPLLGWLPAIPRYGSRIMVSSFLLSALHVTDGIPAYAQRRQVVADFYERNADALLEIPGVAHRMQSCGREYYGSTITFTAAYALARLETDPTRARHVREDLLLDGKWPPVATHKNAYYALITTAFLDPPDAEIVAIATTQLALFPPPPRIEIPVDLTGQVTADGECTSVNGSPTAPADQALDVNLRPVEDFQWQRHPWALYGAGALNSTMPGVDFMVAYWMARAHGFLADDRPGVCTRSR